MQPQHLGDLRLQLGQPVLEAQLLGVGFWLRRGGFLGHRCQGGRCHGDLDAALRRVALVAFVLLGFDVRGCVGVVRVDAAHAHLQAQVGLLEQCRLQLLGQTGRFALYDEGDHVLFEQTFTADELQAAGVGHLLLEELAARRGDGLFGQQDHSLLAGDGHQRVQHEFAFAHLAYQRDHLRRQQRRALGLVVFLRRLLGCRLLLLGQRVLAGLALLAQRLVEVVEVVAELLVGLVGLAQQVGLLVQFVERVELFLGAGLFGFLEGGECLYQSTVFVRTLFGKRLPGRFGE